MKAQTLIHQELLHIAQSHYGRTEPLPVKLLNILSEISALDPDTASEDSPGPDLHEQDIHSSSPAGVCRMDTNGNIISANVAFCQLLEISGPLETCLNLHSFFNCREDLTVFLRELEKNAGVHIATTWKTVSGFVLNVELIASRFQGVIQVTALDMTDRKIAEIEVHSRLERNEMLLESMHEGLVFADPEGLITYSNKRFAELIGKALTEIPGTHLNHFIPAIANSTAHDTDAPGIPIQMEVVIRVRGQQRWIFVSRREVYDSAEELIGTIFIFTDITRMEHARQRVRETNVQLEKEIKIRRSTEDSLVHQTNDLQQMVDELEKFAYVTAHDLQEPLRSISSYVQLLERRYGDQLDDSALEYIRYAVDGAKHMKRLLQDLLSYITVKADAELPEEPVELDEVVEIAIENLSSKIAEINAEISVDAMPVIRADATQMIHYFEQMLDNAIKFRGRKPLQVHISSLRKANSCEIRISDNGIGFDPAYSSKVFELFQRLHHRDKYPGTGIGLAICRKIAQRHRAKLSVETSEGSGSTFLLVIPDAGLPDKVQ